jgi:hypothetical protein
MTKKTRRRVCGEGNMRFTVPPAVALLNYTAIREAVFANFFQYRDFSRGFLNILYYQFRQKEVALGGAGVGVFDFFRVQCSAFRVQRRSV